MKRNVSLSCIRCYFTSRHLFFSFQNNTRYLRSLSVILLRQQFYIFSIHSKRLYSAIFFIEKFNPGKILLLKSSESSDHPRETSVRKLFKFYFEIPLLVSPLSSKNIFDPPLPVRNHWRRSAVSSLPVSPKIANRERTILQCCWFPYMQIRAATHARIFPRSPNQPACPCS